MNDETKYSVNRRRGNDRRRSPHHEKRSFPYSDRREERRADGQQMDLFAVVALGVFLDHALEESTDGKVDFEGITRASYLCAKAMMRQRREFGRDYSEGEDS